MDYENVYLNCDGPSASTAWRNTQQPSPSYFADTFAPASTSRSFPTHYCHSSLEHPNCVNYLAYMPNDANGNNSHHAFHQHYTHFRHTDGMRFQTYQGVPAYNFKMKGKDYCEHQQPMRMLLQAGTAGPGIKTNHMKQNNKRKKKQHSQAKNKSVNGLCPMPQMNCNRVTQMHLTGNSFNEMPDIPKWAPNDLSSLDSKEAESMLVSNECYPESSTLQYSTNNCEFQTVANLNQSIRLNSSASVITDSNLNMESDLNLFSQQPNINNCTDEDAGITVFNIPEDNAATNSVTEENAFPQTEYIYLSEELPTEVYNTNSEVQITEQGHEQNTETEHFTLQTMFEGKDESGKDIIVLVTAPEGHQNVIQESLVNSDTNILSAGTKNNSETTADAGVGKDLIVLVTAPEAQQNISQEGSANYDVNTQSTETENSSEIISDAGMQIRQELYNTQNEIEFFISSINDFAHQEIVGTVNKCSKTKENKNMQNASLCKKQASGIVNQEQAKKKKCNKGSVTAQTANSENKQIPNGHNDQMKNSCLPWTQDGSRNKVKLKNRLKWKTHFQPAETAFNGLQKRYFRQFMKRFKLKNNVVNDDILQKMMNVILYKIGGNVFQSIYKTFQELIKIYNTKDNQQHSGKK